MNSPQHEGNRPPVLPPRVPAVTGSISTRAISFPHKAVTDRDNLCMNHTAAVCLSSTHSGQSIPCKGRLRPATLSSSQNPALWDEQVGLPDDPAQCFCSTKEAHSGQPKNNVCIFKTPQKQWSIISFATNRMRYPPVCCVWEGIRYFTIRILNLRTAEI